MKVTPKTINRELRKLSVYYPQAKRSQAEIVLLTKMWMEDLHHLDEDVFLEAVSRYRQRSEFFPTGKGILDICQDIWSERKRNTPRLVEPWPDLPPEQVKENVERIKQLTNGIGKAVTVSSVQG